ncbi:dsbG domain protein, partial [Acidithiobacillus sp. GGI-221]
NDSGIQNIMNSFLMFCVLCLMSMSVAMAGDAPHGGSKSTYIMDANIAASCYLYSGRNAWSGYI